MDLDEQFRSINYLLQSGNIEKASSVAHSIPQEAIEGDLNAIKYSLIQQKILLELGDFESALDEARKTETSSRKLKSNSTRVQSMVNQIHAYIALGEHNQALRKAEEVESLLDRLSDREKAALDQVQGDLSNLWGLLMQTQGSYEDALSHYERALSMRMKLGHQRDIGLTQYNIGSVLELQGDIRRAIEFYTMAENTFKGINYYTGLSAAYTTLKKAYTALEDADKIFEYEQNLRDLEEKTKLSHRLLDAAKEIRRLSDELSNSNKERIELEQKLWSLEFQLNSLRADESDSFAENQVETLREELEELRAHTKEVEEILHEHQEEKEKLEKENVELKDSIDRIEQELERSKALEAKIQQSSQKITEFQEQLEKSRARVLTLETELANSRKELQIAQEELSKREEPSKEELETKDREIQNIKSEYEQKIRKLEYELETLKEENERLRKEHKIDIEKRDEELSSLKLRLENIESRGTSFQEGHEELESLKRKKVELTTELNELKKELEEKRDELIQVKSKEKREVHQIDKQPLKPHMDQVQSEMKSVSIPSANIREGQENTREIETGLRKLKEQYQQVRQKHHISESRRQDRIRATGNRLEDILSESKLAQQIYQLLQSTQSIQLRFLSMRLGVNMQTCRREVEKLVDARYLTINTSKSNDNPLIELSK